jgi:uncharacterized Zn-binding protein involved in type VI secretion
MPSVQRQGDSDSGGGVIVAGINSVRTNGIPTATINMPVSAHSRKPTHVPQTAGGVPSVRVAGQAISVTGNADTCGHARVGGSFDVRAG